MTALTRCDLMKRSLVRVGNAGDGVGGTRLPLTPVGGPKVVQTVASTIMAETLPAAPVAGKIMAPSDGRISQSSGAIFAVG